MSSKLLHTRTKIFFKDPYVVRVEYPNDVPYDDRVSRYGQLARKTYRLIKGTWGYCQLDYELVQIPDKDTPLSPANQNLWVQGLPGVQQQIFAAIFAQDSTQVLRGYFCFKDEMDALQFRLSLDTTAVQVRMWPERWFTIHEVTES